ncbi:terpene synthase [Bacillus velezensis]|uniref:terpene synthase n=1 Tax=Bacillus velezensis TaxID=492670 RepID=UPI0032D94281
MLSLNRALKLRDLEVFRVLKDGNILSYVIIEDTRKPFTEEDKKLEPLCYMDEEDINAILNVFKISIVNDEKLNEDNSIFIRSYFSEFVNHTNLTNFIIKEYVQKDLYEDYIRLKIDIFSSFWRIKMSYLQALKSGFKRTELLYM